MKILELILTLHCCCRKPNPRLVSSSLLSSIRVSPDPRLSHMVSQDTFSFRPCVLCFTVLMSNLKTQPVLELVPGDAMGAVAGPWHWPLAGSGWRKTSEFLLLFAAWFFSRWAGRRFGQEKLAVLPARLSRHASPSSLLPRGTQGWAEGSA